MGAETFSIPPQYLQLIGVGFLWISLHCAGMCGPIVIGLDLGGNLARGESLDRAANLRAAAAHLFMYQTGRSITYAIMGALAGWGGALLQEIFHTLTRSTGLIVAAIIFTYGVLRLAGRGLNLGFSNDNALGRILVKAAKRARELSGLKQKFALGMILGFLPCMITFWALGLAASTQSALHGALIMVMLVWMTSFVIFGFGLAPAIMRHTGGRLRDRLLSVFLMLSGIWLGLVAAGANDWIDHASISFRLFEKGYTIMFW
jgi:sulfite exporter TauE/SafE